ncbi:MAG: TIGR03905 family TSCPD domain-containing protein [Lactobacillales bacterium]|jgi:uncharacterized protein (TIGR03905 family)|nr:TIGR03905 family TSCPD domain-containing protein [Lactobacillales bacterium]
MIKSFKPNGVCAKELIIDHENGVINSIEVIGGCPGNAKGVAALLVGMEIPKAIERLKGITCADNDTSCPDQIALALEEILAEN